MSENQKSVLVDLFLGLVIAIAIFFWKSGPEYALLHLLSDCTFVSAVILLGMGGLRLCVNSGSLDKKLLEKYGSPTPEALAESALTQAEMLEDCGFSDIVISIKSGLFPSYYTGF